MLSDAIKGNVETMVRPVRTRFFDPRTGEPCDSRPEPLRREKGRETVEERNAAIAKRERDEKEARGAEARQAAQAEEAPYGVPEAPHVPSLREAVRDFGDPPSHLLRRVRQEAPRREGEGALRGEGRAHRARVRRVRPLFRGARQVPKAHVLRGLREGAKAGARARVEGGDEGRS